MKYLIQGALMTILYSSNASSLPLNSEKISALEKIAFEASDEHRTQALLVFKDNKIVFEKYAQGIDGSTSLTVYSLGQLMLHLATGYGISKGMFAPEVKLPEIFGPLPPGISPEIRLLDLLRLSSGLRYFRDMESNDRLAWGVFSPIQFQKTHLQHRYPEFLSLSMHPPGAVYNFGFIDRNLVTYSLIRLFKKESLDDFFSKRLIKKLGLKSTFYRLTFADPDSTFFPPINYSAINVRSSAYDILKMIQVYLNQGRYEGQKYFDKDWTDLSWQTTTGQAYYKRKLPGNQTDTFGTFWFLNRPHPGHGQKFVAEAPEDLVMIRGHKGQFLALIPSERLILIRLGDDLRTSPYIGKKLIEALFK
jgi:CubicO group peptidase (beta-lactamase class C family)